jgi:hypothetical protein
VTPKTPLEWLLESRYSPPAWALLWEVPNGTGACKDRTADAMAMSLWPSRGLDLHGFEMKKSRNDWLKELKTPQKAEAFVGFCDYWWIVAEKDVVKLDELPTNWGLLVRAGKTLRAKKEAPRLEGADPDRAFLASIFRQISTLKDKYILRSEIKNELDERWREGLERGKDSAKCELESEQKALDRREQELEKFEEASGIKLPQWHGGERIGAAVKLVLESDVSAHARFIERLVGNLERTTDELKGVLDEWKERAPIDDYTLMQAAFLRLSDMIEMMGPADDNRLEYKIRRETWEMLEANGIDTCMGHFQKARDFMNKWLDDRHPSEDKK